MNNNPPNPEKGAYPNPGPGELTPNTTGSSRTDMGASPPAYSPSSAGTTSGLGRLHTGATATSDEFPTAVEYLVSPVMGSPYQIQRKPVSSSVPVGSSGAADYSSSSQYPPDVKKDPFAHQLGYSKLSYTQPSSSLPGYNSGSHYESAVSPPSVTTVTTDPKESPPYQPTTNPSFFSPDTVGTYHTTPTPAYSYAAPTPTYTSPLIVRPIAIPQTSLQTTSPLLQAYPPELLAKGIPRDRWFAFLASLSALLGASDSENFKAHRADIGREMGKAPTAFGKSIADHAVQIGQDLKKHARNGNILGATGTLIGGAIAWPVATSLKSVGAVFTMPSAAMQAIAKKPLKRHERAALAAADAGKGWLHERGFHASLMGTEELAVVTGIEARRFVDTEKGGPRDAADKMRLMVERLELAPVEVQQGLGGLEVGSSTLWLVLVPYARDNAV